MLWIALEEWERGRTKKKFNILQRIIKTAFHSREHVAWTMCWQLCFLSMPSESDRMAIVVCCCGCMPVTLSQKLLVTHGSGTVSRQSRSWPQHWPLLGLSYLTLVWHAAGTMKGWKCFQSVHFPYQINVTSYIGMPMKTPQVFVLS